MQTSVEMFRTLFQHQQPIEKSMKISVDMPCWKHQLPLKLKLGNIGPEYHLDGEDCLETLGAAGMSSDKNGAFRQVDSAAAPGGWKS